MPLAIITGANTGLGFETARGLLGLGYGVVITSRDLERGDKAVARLRTEYPEGEISTLALDLANQSSVKAFAPRFAQAHKKWDVLVLNAGAKVLSSYQETDSGIEYHFGVNAVGHFALVADLLALRAPVARWFPSHQLSPGSHQVSLVRQDQLWLIRPVQATRQASFPIIYSPWRCKADSVQTHLAL